MPSRRRVDVDVIVHPEQAITGFGAAGAAATAFGAQVNGLGAKAMAGTGAADIAAAGAMAGERTAVGFAGRFGSKLREGFAHAGKSALTDVGATMGGETGAVFAGSFGSSAMTGMSKLMPVLIAAFAGVEIAKGVKGVADSTAEYEAGILRIKQITGGTAHDASLLGATFHGLGINVDSVQRPLGALAKNLDAGGGPLRKYLSDTEIAKLRSEDLGHGLEDLIHKYQSIEDPIKRDAFAVATFGNRGLSAILPLLNSTDEMRRGFEATAEKAGLVFTDAQLQQARQYQIANRELEATFKGLEVQIGEALIPALTHLLQSVGDLIIAGEHLSRVKLPDWGGVGQAAGGSVGGLVGKFIGANARVTADIASMGTYEIYRHFHHAKGGADELGAALDEANRKDAEFAQGLQDTAAAADATQKGVEAMVKSLDPLKDFKIPNPAKAADDLATAEDRLASARERQQTAQKRLAENERYIVRTPGRDKALAADQREVASATREITKAQKEANDARAAAKPTSVASTVTKDYHDQVSKMTRFVKELDDAARRGVDPAFLQKAIADPDKYLPILDALEKDTGGSLERTINSSEASLRTIGTRLQAASEAVGESVAEAVQGGAGKLTGDLATVFHRALTDPKDDVYRLAVSLGTQIKDGLVSGLTTNIPSKAVGSTTGYSGGDLSAVSDPNYQGPSNVPRGQLGPPNPFAGEHVAPRTATLSHGIPGSVTQVHAPQTHSSKTEQHIQIGTLGVRDPKDFERWASRKQRLARLAGG